MARREVLPITMAKRGGMLSVTPSPGSERLVPRGKDVPRWLLGAEERPAGDLLLMMMMTLTPADIYQACTVC